MDPNEELAGYLKIPWQKQDVEYAEGKTIINDNPNFTAPDGIVLLLREMWKRPDYWEFLTYLFSHYKPKIKFKDIYVPITDTTGKLRDAALSFFREREGK